MFNSLEMTTIAQNGFGQHNPLADRYEASAAFDKALLRGKWHALGHRLAGKPSSLRHLPKVDATTARRAASSTSPCHRSSAARGGRVTSIATFTR